MSAASQHTTNQLQFSLSNPPSTKNLAAVFKKPTVITVEKLGKGKDIGAFHQPESTAGIESIDNSPSFSSINQQKLITAMKLAKRDLKNKKIMELADELGLVKEKPTVFNSDALMKGHVKTGNKKDRKKKDSYCTPSVRKSIERQHSKTQVVPSDTKQNIIIDVNSNSSYLQGRSQSPPTRDTDESISSTKENTLVGNLRQCHYQLHQQLEFTRAALKTAIHKASICGTAPKPRGPGLFMVDRDDDAIRRRMRRDEQTTRSTRTIYFLRRQIHDIERDYHLRKADKMWTSPEKIKALTRTLSVFRGAVRCVQTHVACIKELVPSDGQSIDLKDLLTLLGQLLQLRPHFDGSDSCLEFVDESNTLIITVAQMSDNLKHKILLKFSTKKKKPKKIAKQKSAIIQEVLERHTSNLKKDAIKKVKRESSRERVARFRSALAAVAPGLMDESPYATENAISSHKSRSTVKHPPPFKVTRSRSASRHSESARSRSSSVTAPTVSSMRRSTSAPMAKETTVQPWRPAGVATNTTKRVVTEGVIDRGHCRSQSLTDLNLDTQPLTQPRQSPEPHHIQSILKKSSDGQCLDKPVTPTGFCYARKKMSDGDAITRSAYDSITYDMPPSRHRQHGDDVSDPRYAMMEQSSLHTIMQRLDHIKEEQDRIRSKWNSVSFNVPSHNSVEIPKNHVVGEPAPVCLDNLFSSLPQITESPSTLETILFTKKDDEVHMVPSAHAAPQPLPTPTAPVMLKLPLKCASNIREYVQQYDEYLKISSHQTAGIFDPWSLIQQVCDEILDDCLKDIVTEVEGVSSDIVDHVCTSEFTVAPHPKSIS